MALHGSRVHPLASVHPTARLAADVVIHSGAFVGAGAVVSSGCSVGPGAVLADADDDADRQAVERFTVLKEGVRIGAQALLLPGITVARGAVVRPGAVVTRSVPQGAIVEGHPAVIVGYVGADRAAEAVPGLALDAPGARPAVGVRATAVRGVTVHQFPLHYDLRGDLTVGEFGQHIPFAPRRWFMVMRVPSREVRGEHAHRQCHQFLVCVSGQCSVIADDGQHKCEVLLDAPTRGIYLPPMVWGIQYRYSADAVLLVFASHLYDAADYIRDYDDYLARVQAGG
jgi:dTDP-4-dehydrorhamnose 3,5-epimerase-like enzyme